MHDVFADSVEEHVPPPGLAVATYVTPTASPSVCVHEIFRALFCAAATTAVTAPGIPMGKTVTAVDATPTPIALFATTEIE
jgi:hypothetical protein